MVFVGVFLRNCKQENGAIYLQNKRYPAQQGVSQEKTRKTRALVSILLTIIAKFDRSLWEGGGMAYNVEKGTTLQDLIHPRHEKVCVVKHR